MTTIDAPIELHPSYCPIDPAIHPRVADLERGAPAWVERIGLAADDRQRRLPRTR